MSMMRTLVLSEMTGCNFRTEWYCVPPPAGIMVTVTDGEWTAEGGLSVRKIYGWAAVPDYPAEPQLYPVSEHVALQVVRTVH